jgi:ATP-binding cassette subfamily F protein 3
MQHLMDGIVEPRVRGHLGTFGFNKDKADTPIKNLSGGEKARLLFASMSRTAPHIMLMDEPTNHLDVDAREALIAALNAYEGAVILVSHDPHLVELVADTLWVVEDGTCKPFDGDLSEYRQSLLDARRGRKSGADGDGKKDAAPRLDKKAERKARAEARAASQNLRKDAKKAEQDLANLAKEKKLLEQKLAQPDVYNGDREKLTRLQIELGRLDKKMNIAETIWLEAEAKIESGEGS